MVQSNINPQLHLVGPAVFCKTEHTTDRIHQLSVPITRAFCYRRHLKCSTGGSDKKITDDDFCSLPGMTHRGVTHTISPDERCDCKMRLRGMATNTCRLYLDYFRFYFYSNSSVSGEGREEKEGKTGAKRGKDRGRSHWWLCHHGEEVCESVCACVSMNRRKVHIGQRGRACPHRWPEGELPGNPTTAGQQPGVRPPCTRMRAQHTYTQWT